MSQLVPVGGKKCDINGWGSGRLTRAMLHTRHGYWLEEAGAVAPAPPLDGDRDADVVVIGGGFTGLWAAWHLKQLQPNARVVLLEADTCGRGPSGRNGGFCNVMWFSLPNMRTRWGAGGALAVARAADRAVHAIGEFCEDEGLDAWFRMGGYLQVSTAAAHDEIWTEALAACRELGALDAVRPFSPSQVAARCASPAFRAGAFYPAAATVQPARLVLGLRDRLRTRGVELYESTPVRALRDARDGVEVRTPGGMVRARAAVVAIGGAATARHGPLRNRLTITSSHIVLTEPVPDLLEEVGWTGGECITDCRTMLHYFRATPDGRIAFGLGGGRISMGGRLRGRVEVDPEVVARAAERLRAYFPGIEGRRITHAWGGPIDVSPTHLPVVVPLSGGHAFAAAGYTGNGVGPSHMVGRTLASLALDRRDEYSRLPIVDPSPQRVPPEPFHWIGGSAIHAAIMAKENAESNGRSPSKVASTLARVPELIGFHMGR
jgi:glycine/D-amino acid oxidase-like deaminating enzyme